MPMSDWRPTTSLSNLKFRATLINQIRAFFDKRDVLEVDTPLICQSTATDPFISSFETQLHPIPSITLKTLYLQTSPEFAMKRLIAAGYGNIYQICKAFRNGEYGKKHNPEFTILEWYRVNFTHHELMDEMDDFLQDILKTQTAQRVSYCELFHNYFGFNPHTCSIATLQNVAAEYGLVLNQNNTNEDRDTWLDLLLTHLIEPKLGLEKPIFIFDYPASQAALAKVRQVADYAVGERFEVYFKGIELANGYHELGDQQEQHQRFEKDNTIRKKLKLPLLPIDQHLLNALDTFPNCAGVALGIDRLIMLALNTHHIAEVISFPIERA